MADGDASSNPSNGCKIFVGNISFIAQDHELDDVFSEFGQIVEAAIIKDRETGRSRGYGFVTYEDSASAQNAIEKMHQKEIFGRPLNVKTADTKNTGGGGGAPRSNRGGRNGFYQRQNFNNGYSDGYGGGFGQFYDQGGYDDYYPNYGPSGGYGPGPGPIRHRGGYGGRGMRGGPAGYGGGMGGGYGGGGYGGGGYGGGNGYGDFHQGGYY